MHRARGLLEPHRHRVKHRQRHCHRCLRKRAGGIREQLVAARDGALDGCCVVGEPQREPAREDCGLVGVAGLLRVDKSLLERDGALAPATADQWTSPESCQARASPAASPAASRTGIAATAARDRSALDTPCASGRVAQSEQLELGADLGTAVGRPGRLGDRALQLSFGHLEVAALDQRSSAQRVDVSRPHRFGWKQGACSAEEVRGGGLVAARTGAAAGFGQDLTAALGNGTAMVVERPELGEPALRLLEVVAEDLRVLAPAIARLLLDPVRQALVQARAIALRERVIGSIANQDVPEAERLITGEACSRRERSARSRRVRRGHRRRRPGLPRARAEPSGETAAPRPTPSGWCGARRV